MRITRIKIGCWRSHPVPARSCRFKRQRSLATRSPKPLASCRTPSWEPVGPISVVRLLQEPNASRGEIVYSAHQLHVAPHRADLPFARFKHDPNSPTHVCFDGRAEQLRWRQHLVEIVQGRTNALQERSDAATIASAVELLGDSGLHRPAALMPQDYKQRCVQVCAGVLQRPRDQGAENVSCDSYDEQLAESRIEQELRRHPAVAAPENR